MILNFKKIVFYFIFNEQKIHQAVQEPLNGDLSDDDSADGGGWRRR